MSFGEPLMAGAMPAHAGDRFEASAEKWWAKWRALHVDARGYDHYGTTSWLGRLFKKHLMSIALAIVAIIAMLIYVIGMSVCYVSDEVVAPRLRYQRYRREQRRAMRHAERQMVQSDLE